MNLSRIPRSHFLLMYQYLLIAISLVIFLPCLSMSSSGPVRFFRLGDGKINIRNEHNGQEAKENLFDPGGMLNEKALNEIDAIFGFPDSQKGEHISLRLLFLLDYFSDKIAPGKIIHLTSGYRSPAYNQKLRESGGNVASTSTHMDGMAMDFYLDRVNGKTLWNTVRKENCCGVGHYGGKNIHLDSGKSRFWEAATSKVGTKESELNRKIYLLTEYDRYRPGEKVRFFLTSVSDFPFGIQKAAVLFKGIEGKSDSIPFTIQAQNEEECILINDRNTSRSIYGTLPAGLEPGRYKIRFDFCKRPFEQMPTMALSNEIEIIKE